MGVKTFIKDILQRMGAETEDGQIVRTKYDGDFNLAKPSEQKRFKRVVIDRMNETNRLVEHDISHWRRACQSAINAEQPNRCHLYDIYRDVELDNHLSGAVEQVNGFVKCRAFKLVDAEGNPDDEALAYFQTEWFRDFVDYVLESRYWGYSLIELGDIITDEDGKLSFDGLTIVDRKHVIPEYGRVVKNAGDDWHNGVDYRERPYADWYIGVGKTHDLGLYEKAALQTIPKKYSFSFWENFEEMFGIPIRVAKTSSRDATERAKLGAMMQNMGHKAWGVFGDDTEIELVETSKGDSYNVYDKRIERANSELSKLILQQTMTIDDGSSKSQSETHMDVFRNLITSICDLVKNTVNNKLIPRMARFGFPVKGLRFEWDDPDNFTPEQKIRILELVLSHYKVPASYINDTYDIPAEDKPEIAAPEAPEPPVKPTTEDKHNHPFFD